MTTTAERHIGSAFNGVATFVGEEILYPGLKLIYTNDELASRQGQNNDFFHGLADRGEEVSDLYAEGHVLSGIAHANLSLVSETAKEGGRQALYGIHNLIKGQYWNNIVVGAFGTVVGIGAGSMISKLPIIGSNFLTSFFAPIAGGFIGGIGGFSIGDTVMTKLHISLESTQDEITKPEVAIATPESYMSTDYAEADTVKDTAQEYTLDMT